MFYVVLPVLLYVIALFRSEEESLCGLLRKANGIYKRNVVIEKTDYVSESDALSFFWFLNKEKLS